MGFDKIQNKNNKGENKVSLNTFIAISLIVSFASFAFAAWLYQWVKARPSKNPHIAEIGKLIRAGANTFMRKEYVALAKFAGIAMLLILILLPRPIWVGDPIENITMAIVYLAGTVLSAIAGIIGVRIATIANVKTAEAAKKGIEPAFKVSFRGGAVMGMAVVGSTILGVALVMLITGDSSYVLGFSFGASSLALFAKAGGGIFTKTADISADLVGKVELGIPEDDPRNPAVIADNVGDNVGDVAGMGADLFDSSVAAMAAAFVLAGVLDKSGGFQHTAMVLCYASAGLLASMIGVMMARMGKKGGPTQALNKGTYITTGIFLVLTALATFGFGFEWRIWGASAMGLVVGVLIGIITNYFTDDGKKPVRETAESSKFGPAFTILLGNSYGFMSVLPALAGIGIAGFGAYKLCEPLGNNCGVFGIAMAAVGMLSIVGIVISNDAYGPIVDNARGLAEMGNLGEEVIRVSDKLDSAGNTVKATTKGIAVCSAGITVIALLHAFMSEVNTAAAALGLPGIVGFDIMNPNVSIGFMFGLGVPVMFCALLILGVIRNSRRMTDEIHHQFNTIPGLKEGKPGVVPKYDRCIEVATNGALRELLPAGLFTIAATLIVGFIGGAEAIGGFLYANIGSGLVFALFMSNAGGLWDNAKKLIEDGFAGGKGSDSHKAAVIGDTVGDPFKDTAGPSINTQITVVSLVASLCAALFLQFSIF